MDEASSLGLLDNFYTGRGTALLDANHDGLIDIVYGNWQGQHRLYVQSRNAAGDASFTDVAPSAMAASSPIRTVIAADFDNDGYDEIFWNHIPGANRLFRKLPSDADWTPIDAGAATDASGYGTGGVVGDFDGDGVLELVVAHGESASQPLSLRAQLRGGQPLAAHQAPHAARRARSWCGRHAKRRERPYAHAAQGYRRRLGLPLPDGAGRPLWSRCKPYRRVHPRALAGQQVRHRSESSHRRDAYHRLPFWRMLVR